MHIPMFRTLLIVAVGSLTLAGALRAAAAEAAAAAAEAAAAANAAAPATYRVNFPNTELRELVTLVARITGRTFVVDPRVKGKITIISDADLDADGVYQLFLSVLRVHGFSAISAGNVIRIQQQTLARQSGDRDEDRRGVGEDFVTRVIPAQNVDSNELIKIVRPMVPQYAHLAAITTPNVVIISDHAQNIERLVSLIREIDVVEEESTLFIALEHAWVGDIAKLLEKVAPDQVGGAAKGPQRVLAIANERSNSLVLRGKPRPLERIRALVDEFDQPATASGMTEVIPLAHADATEVAELLRSLTSGQAAAPVARAANAEGGAAPAAAALSPGSIQADKTLNAIVVRADPSELGEIKALIAKLDVRRPQVLIEAAIVEVSLTETDMLGVDVAAADASGKRVPLISTALSTALARLLGELQPTAPATNLDVIGGAATLTQPSVAVAKIDTGGVSFGALIQALATNSDANLLSTPSILTLDNQEAKITVGQSVPFRTGSFTTDNAGANNPFTTIQRQDVGITLKVTPHIHEGSVVRLEVSQEASSVVDAAIGDAGFSDIVTNKRTIDTVILADDGQTIVLGGLIQDDVTNTDRRVPLLGDIPVLGRLFRSTSEMRDKRNLLVFLRPTVIRDAADVEETTQRKATNIWQLGDTDDSSAAPPIDSFYDGRARRE
jgi:general secretion pathway protein D